MDSLAADLRKLARSLREKARNNSLNKSAKVAKMLKAGSAIYSLRKKIGLQ